MGMSDIERRNEQLKFLGEMMDSRSYLATGIQLTIRDGAEEDAPAVTIDLGMYCDLENLMGEIQKAVEESKARSLTNLMSRTREAIGLLRGEGYDV